MTAHEAHEFINDLWHLMKDTIEPVDDEKYWEGLVSKSNEVSIKYGNNEYFNTMLLAWVDYCEDEFNKTLGKTHKADRTLRAINSMRKRAGRPELKEVDT